MRGRRSTRNGSTGTVARTRGSGGGSGTQTNRTRGEIWEEEGGGSGMDGAPFGAAAPRLGNELPVTLL